MIVSPAIATRIVDYALGEVPKEACGLVVVVDNELVSFVPTPNVDENPRTGFTLPEAALWFAVLLTADGRVDVGYFHSHVDDVAVPSSGDLRRGVAGQLHLIASTRTGELAAFRFETTADERYFTRLKAVDVPLEIAA